jgi:hypothetical protein
MDLNKFCEMCNEHNPSVGLATGENNEQYLVCRYCDVDGSNYNGWGDVEPSTQDIIKELVNELLTGIIDKIH